MAVSRAGALLRLSDSEIKITFPLSRGHRWNYLDVNEESEVRREVIVCDGGGVSVVSRTSDKLFAGLDCEFPDK